MALIALALPSFASAEPEPFGTVTQFPLGAGAFPTTVAAGPDGNLWTSEFAGLKGVNKVTTSGSVTGFHAAAEGAATLTEGSATITSVSVTSGEVFAGTSVIVTASGVPSFTSVVSCSPSCASPTSIELSNPVEAGKSGTGVEFTTSLPATGIAAGSDGDLWFIQGNAPAPATYPVSIDRMTPGGVLTRFTTGLNSPAAPIFIAPGPDGNLWFTDKGNPAPGGGTPSIGRITPTGTITMFSAGLQAASKSRPVAITPGPDGNMWFTDMSASAGGGGINEIGKVNLSTEPPTIEEFSAGLNVGSKPGNALVGTAAAGLAPGPDGNVWFTDSGTTKAIGKITPSGTITEYSAGLNAGAGPQSIVAAKGDLWFTDTGTTKAIGEVDPSSGAIVEYSEPSYSVGTGTKRGIALGPDGNLWYGDGENLSRFWINTGPTNRRLLTLTKSPSPSTGTGVGTVKSKPKGINCASACSGAEASLFKETTVLISAKAATGSSFTGWEGCESETVGPTEGTCTVKMSEDQAVEAKFGGTSKAIPNPQQLTLTKAGTGIGTVKSKPGGIACETECTTTSALYAGAITEPKPKAATKVILTVTPVAGSVFSGWSGACSGEALTCEVEMTEAKEAIAEFTALPKNTLSVTKSPSPSAGTGLGTVKSKPKGINCASACSEESASFAEDTTVVLAAKAASGSTLLGWEGCESETVGPTEGTCTVAMSEAQSVTAEFGGTSKAIANPQALTLAKAGSGYGTVKSKPGGIACEALCTATTALYQGTLTEPKPKAAATVILTATSAAGSQPVVWSGCDEVNGEGQCVVSMSEAKEVTATFNELE